jgi:hypothetical protein
MGQFGNDGLSLLDRARALRYRVRIGIVLAIAIMVAIIAVFVPPIPQDPSYHNFADSRALLGIPNFGDVMSNVPFFLVGALGIAFFFQHRNDTTGEINPQRWPFFIYFVGVSLVAFGSAYYHYAPTNETLFWDRLPMSIAFMALLSAFVVDRIQIRAGLFLLPLLVILGIFSVIYWHLTEQAGQGDLRLYAVVQFFPILAIPLICILFSPLKLDARYLVAMACLYGLAKVFEFFDHGIFDLLDETVSGHTLKHLSAAAAAYMALPMLRNPVPTTR